MFHPFFAAAPPKGTSVGRVRREKYFARRECVFAHFLRENARVGAKSLLSKKATPFFDKLLLPQDPGLQGAAVGVVHPQARRHVDLRRRRPDIRHRRLDAAAAAGAEGPDGFPGQVIAVQERVDDPGRGAPPDGIAQIDGAVLGQVQGLARDPGPGGGVLLLLAGPAGIVVIAQVLAGVGLLRGQLIQVCLLYTSPSPRD